jgi:beta-lactam-binding protein with PASTA domain
MLLALWGGGIGVAWPVNEFPTPPASRIDPAKSTVLVRKTVPNVVGQELRAAQAALASAGFESRAVSTDKTSDGRRIVTRTDPAAASVFGAGNLPVVAVQHQRDPASTKTNPAELPTTKPPTPPAPPTPTPRPPPRPAADPPLTQPTLPPATRPQPALMPDLAGMNCEQAQREVARQLRQPLVCERGGITGRVVTGIVQRQNPPPRTSVWPGGDSQLRVWIEPASVVVPGVLGQNADVAVQRLRGAGLVPRLDPVRPGPWHRVRTQQPAAGARVAPEAVVLLRLEPRLTVPDIIGLDCPQAQERARAAGLSDVQCQEEDAPADAAAGRVRRQQPAAGTTLDTPQMLQAWTSRPRTRVPDLRGQPEAKALQAARNARLVPQVRGPAASAGRVVAEQSPPAGSLVAPDSPLELQLALSVPNLAGRRCDAAQALARTHGLADLNCESRLARPGESLRQIVEQLPAAGTRLAAPRPLKAVVAMPTIVPEVHGLGLADAEARIGQAGLKPRSDAGDGDRDVWQQTPAAGTEVAPGSVVTLATQRMVVVPDLADRPLADARGLIEAIALVAQVDADDGSRRVVRGQEPPPGRRVVADSAVRLSTVRRVTVPDLQGASCVDAQQAAANARVALSRCELDSRSPLVFGTPRVVHQEPAPGVEVDEGSPLAATAAPPWWSLPSQVSALLVAALGLASKLLIGKLRLPMGWRVLPDAAPRVALRMAPDDGPDDDVSRGPRWRVERSAPRAWLRGLRDDEP